MILHTRFHRACAALLILLGSVATAWASAAFWLDGPESPLIAGALSSLPVLALLGAISLPRHRSAAVVLWATTIAAAIAMELGIEPRNERRWVPYVAREPRMEIRGNQLLVRNLRNFDHHSATHFTPRWETRTYDLRELRAVDLFLSYWGPRWIAHSIVSWDFGDQGHLAISIETRMEIGESYSAFRGFFRQYEIYYVVADERDVIRWRTNSRSEDVFLYRLSMSPVRARRILRAYAEEVERVALRPEWYNALTDNCTTGIRRRIVSVGDADEWDWRILVNGRLDELLYARGSVRTDMSFDELRARSWISGAARSMTSSMRFSEEIRRVVPARRRLE